jgi:hypothetical protein
MRQSDLSGHACCTIPTGLGTAPNQPASARSSSSRSLHVLSAHPTTRATWPAGAAFLLPLSPSSLLSLSLSLSVPVPVFRPRVHFSESLLSVATLALGLRPLVFRQHQLPARWSSRYRLYLPQHPPQSSTKHLHIDATCFSPLSPSQARCDDHGGSWSQPVSLRRRSSSPLSPYRLSPPRLAWMGGLEHSPLPALRAACCVLRFVVPL